MKVTLLGALAFIGIAALLVLVVKELQRTNQARSDQPPQPPKPPRIQTPLQIHDRSPQPNRSSSERRMAHRCRGCTIPQGQGPNLVALGSTGEGESVCTVRYKASCLAVSAQ